MQRMVDFSSKTMESRRQWNDTPKMLKERKNCPSKVLYTMNLPFKSEDEIKNLFTHMGPRAVVPSSFGTKDQFQIRWFFQGLGVRGMVLE